LHRSLCICFVGFSVSPETEDAGIVFQPDRMIKQAKSSNVIELRFGKGAPGFRIGRNGRHVNASR
jgi:hypothetical protein